MALGRITKYALLICLLSAVSGAQGILPGVLNPVAASILRPMFSESFGNISTSPAPCGFTASTSCQQTWAAITGTSSIVTCPTGGTVPATDCLKLPNNSTQAAIQTYGTIPFVKQSTGTATVFTFSFYYDSSTVSAFADIATLTDNAGNKAFEMYASSSGSSSFYIGPTGGGVTVSTSTWHTIVVSLNGSSSYTAVDGGTHNTFTANAHDYWQMNLYGVTATSGANVYFGPMTITESGTNADWPPSQFQDWAGQSGTATATSLAAGTHCGNSQNSWSETGSTVTFAFSATSGNSFSPGLKVCGTSYTGNSNIGLTATWSSTATSTIWQQSNYTLYPNVFWGGLFTFAVTSVSNLAQIDFFNVNGHVWWQLCGSTSSTTCSESPGSNTNLLFCVEQSTSDTRAWCQNLATTSGSVTVSAWITGENTSSGTDSMSIYSWSSGLGSLLHSAAVSDNAFSPGSFPILFGDSGSVAPGTAVTVTYSNLIVQYAGGSFPVLP